MKKYIPLKYLVIDAFIDCLGYYHCEGSFYYDKIGIMGCPTTGQLLDAGFIEVYHEN